MYAYLYDRMENPSLVGLANCLPSELTGLVCPESWKCSDTVLRGVSCL